MCITMMSEHVLKAKIRKRDIMRRLRVANIKMKENCLCQFGLLTCDTVSKLNAQIGWLSKEEQRGKI